MSGVADKAVKDEPVVDESEQDDESLIEIGESSLSYFGADFDVSGLVRRLQDKDIVIPRFDPDESQGSAIRGFQRQLVWANKRSEKFIESLLLGWPVPSIFLVLDDDQRYLVLDGQQRLTALRAFVEGRFPDGKPFVLSDVAQHLQSATYDTLSPESRRKLNNTFIQATVIEPLGVDGRESVYRLFGRLNSGGMQLNAQEIRVALYRGDIVDFIRKLNGLQSWRRLFGPRHTRLKDHELILRSLAMRGALPKLDGKWTNAAAQKAAYVPPMSEFLNSFLERHRTTRNLGVRKVEGSFDQACKLIEQGAGRDGLRYMGSLNAAHVDALLGSMMHLVELGVPLSTGGVQKSIADLRNSSDYQSFVTQSTSHRDSVVNRLRIATETLRRNK